jgi:hypothetical protein
MGYSTPRCASTTDCILNIQHMLNPIQAIAIDWRYLEPTEPSFDNLATVGTSSLLVYYYLT